MKDVISRKVVAPASRKIAARHLREKFRMSERRACRIAGLPRSVSQYKNRRVEPEGLRERMVDLASERPRFGFPRIHILLGRDGFVFNHKRIHRMYCEEKLQIRGRKRRRKGAAAAPRGAMPVPDRPHRRWSMDFVHDRLQQQVARLEDSGRNRTGRLLLSREALWLPNFSKEGGQIGSH